MCNRNRCNLIILLSHFVFASQVLLCSNMAVWQIAHNLEEHCILLQAQKGLMNTLKSSNLDVEQLAALLKKYGFHRLADM